VVALTKTLKEITKNDTNIINRGVVILDKVSSQQQMRARLKDE